MAIVYWPRLLCPMVSTIEAVSRTVSGPPTILGTQQAIASSAGVWRVSFDGIPIQTDQRIQIWRALEVMIEGRSNAVMVPLRQRAFSVPLRVDGPASYATPHADGTNHSDGSGYVTSLAAATTIEPAMRGASRIKVGAGLVGRIVPGMMFSIEDRMYSTKAASLVDDATWVLDVWPQLRDDVMVGASAEFGDLRCKTRLASDGEMKLPLTMGRSGLASVAFVEDVT